MANVDGVLIGIFDLRGETRSKMLTNKTQQKHKLP